MRNLGLKWGITRRFSCGGSPHPWDSPLPKNGFPDTLAAEKFFSTCLRADERQEHISTIFTCDFGRGIVPTVEFSILQIEDKPFCFAYAMLVKNFVCSDDCEKGTDKLVTMDHRGLSDRLSEA